MEQKKEALHLYIQKKFKATIPIQAICHNHQAPFDAFADAFFEVHDMMIWLGNRNSGKTLDFAVLSICEALANDDCELANFGAIERQAMRCFGYVKRFIEGNNDLLESVNGKITLGKTIFKNKSWLQVLVATIAGTNSPHPQKLKADEVELIPWNILQEALSMPNSKDNIKATTILGSTRKFAHGPMQRLIDDKMATVYTWCIWEVMEPWPDDPQIQQEVKEVFIRKFGNLDLLPKDLTKFAGFFKWTDLITRVRTLDVETFLAQWMCQKPDSGGLVYARFDEMLNVNSNFVLPAGAQIQIWEDLGYAKDHPNVVLFVYVDPVRMEWTVFDELFLTYKDAQAIIIEVIQKLDEHGLIPKGLNTDPSLMNEELSTEPTFLAKLLRYQQYFTSISGWVCDYHNVSEIAEREKYGCPIWDKVRKEENDDVGEIYKQDNYIPLVRSFIDNRTGKITPNCIKTREELLSYSYKKLPDGRYSDVAEKFNDNSCSALAFGCIRNWPSLAYQPFDHDSNQPDIQFGDNTPIETFKDPVDIMKKVF